MRNYKSWGLISVSILLAAIAAWSAHRYLVVREREIKAALTGTAEQRIIVVPRVDLQAGDILQGNNVASRAMPRDMVPAGAIAPDQFAAFEGLIVKQPIARGTPLLRHLLVGANTDDAFSMLLKTGQRALTFAVDERQATAHLLRPGDFVDVVLVPKTQSRNTSGEMAADPGLQSLFGVIKERARVLATGARSIAGHGMQADGNDVSRNSLGDEGFQTITLAVETSEVAAFIEARRIADSAQGQLLFLLRNPGDEGRGRIAVDARAGTGAMIETYSGGSSSHGELHQLATTPAGVVIHESIIGPSGAVRLGKRYLQRVADTAPDRPGSTKKQ